MVSRSGANKDFSESSRSFGPDLKQPLRIKAETGCLLNMPPLQAHASQ